jgi:hypothetical protein
VYGMIEGVEPITLKAYREYIENITGLNYEKDFYVMINDEILIDDSYIIAGNVS